MEIVLDHWKLDEEFLKLKSMLRTSQLVEACFFLLIVCTSEAEYMLRSFNWDDSTITTLLRTITSMMQGVVFDVSTTYAKWENIAIRFQRSLTEELGWTLVLLSHLDVRRIRKLLNHPSEDCSSTPLQNPLFECLFKLHEKVVRMNLLSTGAGKLILFTWFIAIRNRYEIIFLLRGSPKEYRRGLLQILFFWPWQIFIFLTLTSDGWKFFKWTMETKEPSESGSSPQSTVHIAEEASWNTTSLLVLLYKVSPIFLALFCY